MRELFASEHIDELCNELFSQRVTPCKAPDTMTIQPTNKKSEVKFCTVAYWNEKGEIVQEI